MFTFWYYVTDGGWGEEIIAHIRRCFYFVKNAWYLNIQENTALNFAKWQIWYRCVCHRLQNFPPPSPPIIM
jgi:hypothetical protein